MTKLTVAYLRVALKKMTREQRAELLARSMYHFAHPYRLKKTPPIKRG